MYYIDWFEFHWLVIPLLQDFKTSIEYPTIVILLYVKVFVLQEWL